jgi:hypothetical protein
MSIDRITQLSSARLLKVAAVMGCWKLAAARGSTIPLHAVTNLHTYLKPCSSFINHFLFIGAELVWPAESSPLSR